MCRWGGWWGGGGRGGAPGCLQLARGSEDQPSTDLPQGDCLEGVAELIVKQYKEVKKADVFYIDNKKKVPYFDAEDEA